MARAGESIEDYCRACKVDRLHTIIVVDGGGTPLRVDCDYCHSQHNYRGGPRTGTASPATSRSREASPAPQAPLSQPARPTWPLVSDRERTAPAMALSGEHEDLELLL